MHPQTRTGKMFCKYFISRENCGKLNYFQSFEDIQYQLTKIKTTTTNNNSRTFANCATYKWAHTYSWNLSHSQSESAN